MMTEQERFEQWARTTGRMSVEKTGSGVYVTAYARKSWKAWQAAIASACRRAETGE